MQTLINTIKTFIPLSGTEEALVADLFREIQLPKGSYFVKEGQVCKYVGFLQEGLLRYYINKDGQELTYEFARAGEFTCNYASFLDQSPSDENIQALENTSMLTISHNNLQVFYDKIAAGNKFGRLVVESIFVRAKHQIASLYSDPPDVRYLQFMDLYPDLQQRIPQYYISSYVGVKPPSLSRIRKRLSMP